MLCFAGNPFARVCPGTPPDVRACLLVLCCDQLAGVVFYLEGHTASETQRFRCCPVSRESQSSLEAATSSLFAVAVFRSTLNWQADKLSSSVTIEKNLFCALEKAVL